MEINIKWLGQSAFEIRRGAEVVMIDPWLNANPRSPIKASEVKELDTIVVTHGHFDHFGDTLELMRNTKAKLICTPEIAWYMHKKGFPRGERSKPLSYGGSIKVGGFTFSMVQAVHPSALYAQEWLEKQEFYPDGGATGSVIRTEDGFSLYHAGDTDLFMDMKLIGQKYKPNIVILPIGGRYTMDLESALIACSWLKPEIVIPMHYNTNPDLSIDEGLFAKAIKEQLPETRVEILQPGGTFNWEDK